MHTTVRPATVVVLVFISSIVVLLSGCAVSPAAGPTTATGLAMHGSVHGGQQPLVGANVYLFAANTTGYGQPSLSLMASAPNTSLDTSGGPTNGDYFVTTDSTGSFTITGDYSCTPNTQAYVYALGGNPGSGTNPAAGLLAALGNCPSSGNFLGTTPFIAVNEVSTIAAAYSFAGFATDATHVSSSGTSLAQVGIANAFANAANLASISTGAALATIPSGNATAPRAAVNTLANILASCINSNGAVTGPTNPTTCYTLFTNALSGGTSGAQPTDTATAAINIAHNPGSNVAALFGLGAAVPPFAPVLTTTPNDFALALTFSGGGISQPESLAIDGSGSAWIANHAVSSITEISSSGSFLSGTSGFTGSTISRPQAIAIDPSGNAWVISLTGNTVTKLSSAGAILSGTNGFTGGGLASPLGIAIDGSGNVWTANSSNLGNHLSNGSVTEMTSAGVPATGSPFEGNNLISPAAIAIDGQGNVWVPETTNNSVTKLSNSGSFLSGTIGFTGGGLDYPESIAIDGSGNAWMLGASICTCPGNGGSTVVVNLSSQGASLQGPSGIVWPALQSPAGIAVDGAGNLWISNYGNSSQNFANSSLTEFSNSGSILSTVNGYQAGGGLHGPGSIAIDGSGNVWTVSSSGSIVSEVIGAAVPVVTPLSVGVKTNMLGTRP